MNYIPSQQGSKAANKKGCTKCSSFQHIHVKLHAVSVKRKATISQCVDQSQIRQQYEQTLLTGTLHRHNRDII